MMAADTIQNLIFHFVLGQQGLQTINVAIFLFVFDACF